MTSILANVFFGIVVAALIAVTVLLLIYGPRLAALSTGALAILFGVMVYSSIRPRK